MKFKSAMLTQASGSVGGATFAHNKSGLYVRARSIPTNPNTTFQQAVRNALSQLSQLWATTLTEAQRAAWDVYAANVPVINTLGDSINLTGLNMYVRSNVARIQAGLARVDDGPVIYNLGSETAPTIDAVDAANDEVDVAFTATDDWATEDGAALIVLASRPQSTTINSFIGPYRFAGTIDGNSGGAPTSPAAVSLPFAIAAGQKLFTSIRLSRADGRLSNPFRISDTAA